LLLRGVWWWTIGRMWAETNAMPRLFGVATMVLAVIAIGAALASAPMSIGAAAIWTSERIVLGLWTLALSLALWRAR
ncbi:MAG TPA: hypothetical protein VJQ09_08580, partial [Candidatus Limnocylindria bacterium]|nr:hypothetical protein [Candidatus Limnocylindria bacterium]